MIQQQLIRYFIDKPVILGPFILKQIRQTQSVLSSVNIRLNSTSNKRKSMHKEF